MKKQEMFIWKYDKNTTSGCVEQLEIYIQCLLKTHIINHKIITETSDSKKAYIFGIIFITIKI